MDHRLEIVLLADTGGRVEEDLREAMAGEGFDVTGFDDAGPFLAHLRAGAGDAVVLALEHVDDEATLVQGIRALCGKPIILLQSQGGSEGALDLMELGADDYVCRDVVAEDPVALREFRVRLTTSIRRASLGSRADGDLLTIGDVVLDTRQRTTWKGGHPVRLTRTEFELLARLMANPNTVIPYDDLLREVWSQHQAEQRSYLRTYVSRLRQKLAWRDVTDRTGPRIQAIQGQGYALRLRGEGPAAPRV